MNNYQKIGKLYDYLTVGKRANSGDTYYFFKDDTPESIKDWFQDVTGKYNDYNFADLDEYYRVLNMLTGAIADNPEFTEDDLYEIEWTDTYNADRLDWLKENLNRAYIYDELQGKEFDDFFDIIGEMQEFSRLEFAQYILNNTDSLEV